MLEALHPGRIDLGLGRAPGTDQLTASALRRAGCRLEDDFPEQLRQLLGFFGLGFPDTHPYRQITAVPAQGYRPQMWMLGSSDYGAQARRRDRLAVLVRPSLRAGRHRRRGARVSRTRSSRRPNSTGRT